MAGIKQHFIPQLLLRRFGVKHKNLEKTQVCVYPKSRSPFVAATDGVAAQRFFYSELSSNGVQTLDDRITDHEGQVVTDLLTVDEAGMGEAVPAEAAARIIVHLTIRSDHVRETFASAGRLMATEGMGLFHNPDWVSRAMGLDQATPDAQLLKLMEDEAAKIPGGAALLSQPGIREMLFGQMKVNLAREQPAISAAISTMQGRFLNEMPDIVRKAHVKALDKSLAPEPRLEKLVELEWTIQSAPVDVIALPDCIALADLADDPGLVPAIFVSNSAVVRSIYMPLGNGKFLVGTTARDRAQVPDSWNAAAAAASADFFISARRDPDLTKLIRRLGSVGGEYMDRQLRSAFGDDPRALLKSES